MKLTPLTQGQAVAMLQASGCSEDGDYWRDAKVRRRSSMWLEVGRLGQQGLEAAGEGW